MEPTCPIGHYSLTLCSSDCRTKIRFGTHAEDTTCLSTLWSIRRNDMITGLDRRDIFSNRFNNASLKKKTQNDERFKDTRGQESRSFERICYITYRFMTQDTWEQAFRIKSIQGINISMAQGIGNNFNPNFTTFGWINGDNFFG